TRALSFNFGVAPTNDADVRKALVLATNTEQAAGAAWPGTVAAHEIVSKDLPYFGGLFPRTDLAAAQKLIDGYLQRTNTTSVKPVITCPATTALTNLCQVLKAQWERLKNVSVTLAPQTVGTATGQIMMQAGVSMTGTSNPFPTIFNKWASTGAQNTV